MWYVLNDSLGGVQITENELHNALECASKNEDDVKALYTITLYLLHHKYLAGVEEVEDKALEQEVRELIVSHILTSLVNKGYVEVDMTVNPPLYQLTEKGKKIGLTKPPDGV